MKIAIGCFLFLSVVGCGGTRSRRSSGGGMDDGGVVQDGDCPEQGTLYISAMPFEEEIHAGRGAPQDFSVPLRFWSVGERVEVQGITFSFISPDGGSFANVLMNIQLTDGAGNAFSPAESCPCDHGFVHLALNQAFRTSGTDTQALLQLDFRMHPRGGDRFDGTLIVELAGDADGHPSVVATGEASVCSGRIIPAHRIECAWDTPCP